MSETVSLIVPVHNSKRFLRECVDSILAQTHEDLEVILSDDGSTDSSGALCDEYGSRDPRVKVIHKNGSGLSSARNAGLRAASGDYVYFVDPGDYLIGDCIEKLLKALRSEACADFAFCDFLNLEKNEFSAEAKDGADAVRVLEKNSFREFLADHRSREYTCAVAVWNKLFKASFLEKMFFPEGKWHEDEFFVNKILTRMESCVFVSENLYCCRKNDRDIIIAKDSFDIRDLDVFEAYAGRVQDAWRIGEREFALETAVNGFERLLALMVKADGMMAEGKDIGKILHRKYFEFYKDVFRYLNLGKKIKYFWGLVDHRKLAGRNEAK